jgi:hypothetical protein
MGGFANPQNEMVGLAGMRRKAKEVAYPKQMKLFEDGVIYCSVFRFLQKVMTRDGNRNKTTFPRIEAFEPLVRGTTRPLSTTQSFLC